jgi:hypothetical protein
MTLRLLVATLAASIVGDALADYDKGMAAIREKRYDAALAEFQVDAERGDSRALESLGFIHRMGLGVEKDDKRAAVYFRLAAMQGLASAQHMLGLAYGSGTGVTKDDTLAREWLRKSARRGYEPAKKALANYYPDVSLEPATGPWLEVRKGGGGFLFQGQFEGTRWSFVVFGSDLKQTTEQTILIIDGMSLQLRPVPRTVFASEEGPMLDAHRNYEQKYQRESFPDASFSSHGMCKGGTTGYREWMTTFAQNKSWKYHTYVTFEVGPSSVMMVSSAYGTDEEKEKVARLIEALCRSFKTDW